MKLSEHAEFMLIHRLPRRWHLLKRLGNNPYRLRYEYQQSRRRFERRDDAFTSEAEVLACGEVGRHDGFTFVLSRL